ncbi:MAG: DUF202 domain-containing protein [Chlorobiaceae bacterium]
MREEIQMTPEELSMRRTELSIERTVMSASRTLMGWVRTALSLISFGFTIHKILQTAIANVEYGLFKSQGPRRVVLILIGLGTVSVILGAADYFLTLRRLNELSSREYSPFNFSFCMGVAIGLFGLFLFVTILTHTEVL